MPKSNGRRDGGGGGREAGRGGEWGGGGGWLDGTPEGCSYVKIGGEDGVEEVGFFFWGGGGDFVGFGAFFCLFNLFLSTNVSPSAFWHPFLQSSTQVRSRSVLGSKMR